MIIYCIWLLCCRLVAPLYDLLQRLIQQNLRRKSLSLTQNCIQPRKIKSAAHFESRLITTSDLISFNPGVNSSNPDWNLS